MKKLASANFDLFAEMLTDVQADPEGDKGQEGASGTGGIKPTVQANGRLSAALGELKGKAAGNAQAGKDWNWYQKNNPGYLNELEKTNPTQFQKMLDEYENSL